MSPTRRPTVSTPSGEGGYLGRWLRHSQDALGSTGPGRMQPTIPALARCGRRFRRSLDAADGFGPRCMWPTVFELARYGRRLRHLLGAADDFGTRWVWPTVSELARYGRLLRHSLDAADGFGTRWVRPGACPNDGRKCRHEVVVTSSTMAGHVVALRPRSVQFNQSQGVWDVASLRIWHEPDSRQRFVAICG